MSDLKPLGSEKLQGLDKIKRIIEISNYNNINNINESSSEYSKLLADGNTYHIVKEKNGYIIKSSVNENSIDYREPIQERKYFSSYSQALKRLNIIAKELNENYGNEHGISLFEDKKFVLKQTKSVEKKNDFPEVENVPAPMAPAPIAPESPAMPSVPPMPEEGGMEPADDMGMPPMPEEGGMEAADDDMGMPPMPEDSGIEPGDDMGSEQSDSEPHENGEVNSFRMVQKLLGKATQKIRNLQDNDELSDKDIKYVINTIISAIDLSKLDEETKEDIISKFEEEEIDSEDDFDYTEDSGSEDDLGDAPEVPSDEEEGEMTEENAWHSLIKNTGASAIGKMMQKSMGIDPKSKVESIMDGVFSESKVDKILTKYFKVTEKESKMISESIQEKKDSIMQEVERLAKTEPQIKSSKKIVESIKGVKFIGSTNKNNLIFEKNNNKYKVSPSGKIINE